MKNTYQNIAKSIRSNAKQILESKNIDSTIREMGDLFYTGSYALDLMTWNDIDMQIVLKEGLNPIVALGNIHNIVLPKNKIVVLSVAYIPSGSIKVKNE